MIVFRGGARGRCAAGLALLAAWALAAPLPARGADSADAGSAPAAAPAPLTVPFGGAPGWRLLEAQGRYDAEKKSPWRALGYEALVPGLGNIYAGEREDAVLTWSGMLVGLLFLVEGKAFACWSASSLQACGGDSTKLAIGSVFLVGSRLFGLAGAPLNVERTNRALRARLGLDGPLNLSLSLEY